MKIPPDVLLGICAEMVDDLEEARKAAENRLRAYTGDDPECYGLTVHHPNVLAAMGTLTGMQALEKNAVKNLEKAMKKHPLGPWVERTRGVGLKQAARLLAAVGDPYWNAAEDRPRTVGELFSYCGLHPGTGVRVRGQQANWSANAKMRVWLIAKQSVITRGHYREDYDKARGRYAGSVHTSECRRCGPKGKPALPGSLMPPAHQQGMAYRIVMREILRDLWQESKNLHLGAQNFLVSQVTHVA